LTCRTVFSYGCVMKRPLRVAGIGLVATLLLTPGLAASADSIAPLVVAPAPFYLESDAAHGFMYETRARVAAARRRPSRYLTRQGAS
jgi:hypothetical protein